MPHSSAGERQRLKEQWWCYLQSRVPLGDNVFQTIPGPSQAFQLMDFVMKQREREKDDA